MATYEINLMRAALAIGAGAIAGGLLTGLFFSLEKFPSQFWLRMFGIFTIFATVPWLVGISVVGCPVWYWLHRRGHQSSLAAAYVGAVAPATFFLVFYFGRAGRNFYKCFSPDSTTNQCGSYFSHVPMGLQEALISLFSFGFAGTIVGLIIWSIAYRRSENAHA